MLGSIVGLRDPFHGGIRGCVEASRDLGFRA